MAQSSADDDIRTECIVAAILTTAVLGPDATTSQYAVRRYAETLQQLRAMGGFDNPMAALLNP